MEIVCNKFILQAGGVRTTKGKRDGEREREKNVHIPNENKGKANWEYAHTVGAGKKIAEILKGKRNKKKRSYVDDGCEQGIFQLKYQEPNKRWSTHL